MDGGLSRGWRIRTESGFSVCVVCEVCELIFLTDFTDYTDYTDYPFMAGQSYT
ncbi:hypothetical protein SAMN04488090_0363 [Siphonobacter aquaeclarae]|uniref:Uncharacterized protein n=1 Tax=Siphonobacter aquaeclarae TaxID=563176 RepID=A0A1G9I764_9BACT|nr:hypothetical protein SAMN04488090_0363 [Siphonobacter aquaeclarae]